METPWFIAPVAVVYIMLLVQSWEPDTLSLMMPGDLEQGIATGDMMYRDAIGAMVFYLPVHFTVPADFMTQQSNMQPPPTIKTSQESLSFSQRSAASASSSPGPPRLRPSGCISSASICSLPVTSTWTVRPDRHPMLPPNSHE